MTFDRVIPKTPHQKWTAAGYVILFLFLVASMIASAISGSGDSNTALNLLFWGWFLFLVIRLLRNAVTVDVPQQLLDAPGINPPPYSPLLTSSNDTPLRGRQAHRYQFDGYSGSVDWINPSYNILPRTVTRRLSMSSSTSFSVSYCVATFQLAQPMPHLFIDGLGQNIMTTNSPNLWALAKLISRRNKLPSLEGNFSDYFQVYAAGNDAIAALSVLTPDVMLKLRDNGFYFDYEVYRDHLYIISEPNFIRRYGFACYTESISAVLHEIIPQLSNRTSGDTSAELQLNPAHLKAWGWLYSIKIIFKWILLVTLSMLVTLMPFATS